MFNFDTSVSELQEAKEEIGLLAAVSNPQYELERLEEVSVLQILLSVSLCELIAFTLLTFYYSSGRNR